VQPLVHRRLALVDAARAVHVDVEEPQVVCVGGAVPRDDPEELAQRLNKEDKARWHSFVESDGKCSRKRLLKKTSLLAFLCRKATVSARAPAPVKKKSSLRSLFVDSEGPEELLQRLKLVEHGLEEQVPLACSQLEV